MDNYNSSKTVLASIHQGKNASLKMDNFNVTIKESNARKITAIWQYGHSPNLPGEFNFIVKDSSRYITLQWQFNQKIKWYPWEKFGSIFSDKALGPYMERSLDKLKHLAEKSG